MSKCVGLPIPHFGFCEAVSSNNFLFDPEGDHFFCWENVGRKEFTNNSAHNLSEYIKLKNYFVDTYSFHRDECENCKIFSSVPRRVSTKKIRKWESAMPAAEV